MSPRNPPYIGRFAPSPTGELHQGSLFTALASFLDARRQQGRWLVRMEDLDPPREQAGAATAILRSLAAHQLCWDGEVMYQSQRQEAYAAALRHLTTAGLTYRCSCSRQRCRQMAVYDRHCLHHGSSGSVCAIRVKIPAQPEPASPYLDLIRGSQHHDLKRETGDFIILRKDGLYAYHLAVVVDDIAQGISHIIRGGDLLDSAPRQRLLFHLLGARTPQMGHLPVLVNREQQKLSKQTHATPLDNRHASANLLRALRQLGMPPPHELSGAPCTELLNWAIGNWDRTQIPPQQHLVVGN